MVSDNELAGSFRKLTYNAIFILKENNMSKSMHLRFTAVMLAFAMMTLLGAKARAQVNSIAGSGSQTCFNAGSPVGSFNYNWQVDQAPLTTTVTSTAGVNMSVDNVGCLLQIPPITLPAAITIHEVHGNFSLTTWNTYSTSGNTCAVGSVIAQLRDSAGNAIAAAKMQVLGPGTTNVPINATFATPLSASSVAIIYFADRCGPQTITFTLVMN